VVIVIVAVVLVAVVVVMVVVVVVVVVEIWKYTDVYLYRSGEEGGIYKSTTRVRSRVSQMQLEPEWQRMLPGWLLLENPKLILAGKYGRMVPIKTTLPYHEPILGSHGRRLSSKSPLKGS
jgi:hypothetical protein